MSRWSLLRSNLLEGCSGESTDTSIHRFQGFNVLTKRKKIIKGFERTYDINDIKLMSMEVLVDDCALFMQKCIDTTELFVHITSHSKEQIDYVESFVNPFMSGSSTREYNDCVVTYVNNNNCRDNSTCTFSIYSRRFKPTLTLYHYFEYKLPVSCDFIHIYTREKRTDVGVGIKGILSNKLHGIDNTGNVRVWPAESILLHILLQCCQDNAVASKLLFPIHPRHLNLLELGGGLTGLCSLGLAAYNSQLSETNKIFDNILSSDGHPDCVLNQEVCISLTSQENNRVIGSQVSLLRWSKHDIFGDVARIKVNLIHNQSHDTFDVITAADCLFFRDYHDDLLWVLNNSINILNDNSVIYLLQPRRDNTMDIFITKAAQFYEIFIFEDYNVDISRLRQEHQGVASYDEDIHYPVLVVMKWKHI